MKSYISLSCNYQILSGNDGKPPIILYDYKSSRSGDHAEEYLEGFKGYHHCDGYSGYNKLEDVIRCGCWAHLRRKFMGAIPDKRAKGAPMTNAEIGRDYCNKLFNIEQYVADILLYFTHHTEGKSAYRDKKNLITIQ